MTKLQENAQYFCELNKSNTLSAEKYDIIIQCMGTYIISEIVRSLDTNVIELTKNYNKQKITENEILTEMKKVLKQQKTNNGKFKDMFKVLHSRSNSKQRVLKLFTEKLLLTTVIAIIKKGPLDSSK